MDYPEIEVEGYNLEPVEYFRRGRNLRKRAVEEERPDFLFYAAFEFRCCVEQVLKLYLELIDPDGWSNTLENIYRTKKLRTIILDKKPEFYNNVEFVDICIRAIGLKGVYSIDLDDMDTHYGKVGNFLHAQVRPEQTVKNSEWWGRFFGVLRDAENYLHNVLSHDLAFMDMNKDGWDLYNKWKNGDLSDQELEIEFKYGVQNSA